MKKLPPGTLTIRSPALPGHFRRQSRSSPPFAFATSIFILFPRHHQVAKSRGPRVPPRVSHSVTLGPVHLEPPAPDLSSPQTKMAAVGSRLRVRTPSPKTVTFGDTVTNGVVVRPRNKFGSHSEWERYISKYQTRWPWFFTV